MDSTTREQQPTTTPERERERETLTHTHTERGTRKERVCERT